MCSPTFPGSNFPTLISAFRPPGPRQLHFTKHNYGDQYAIVGKSKELHCCLGPEWDLIQWTRDDMPYPWENYYRRRNTILYRFFLAFVMKGILMMIFSAKTSP